MQIRIQGPGLKSLRSAAFPLLCTLGLSALYLGLCSIHTAHAEDVTQSMPLVQTPLIIKNGLHKDTPYVFNVYAGGKNGDHKRGEMTLIGQRDSEFKARQALTGELTSITFNGMDFSYEELLYGIRMKSWGQTGLEIQAASGFDPSKGGAISIRYLRWRGQPLETFSFELKKAGNRWVAYSRNSAISALVIHENRVKGSLKGIGPIDSEPAQNNESLLKTSDRSEKTLTAPQGQVPTPTQPVITSDFLS